MSMYECSSAQKRLYSIKQLIGDSTVYNLPFFLIIEGELDKERLQNIFKKLIQRHEILRTAFKLVDEQLLQIILPDVEFAIRFSEKNNRDISEIITEFVRSFDLANPPLFRVEFVRLAEKKYLFLFDIDHIITDGFSNDLLVKEIIDLYSGKELPPVEVQYVDFALWQAELFESSTISVQENYWLETFSGEIPVLNLPTDYPRPLKFDYTGATVCYELSEELHTGLRKLSVQENVTLFVTLLAIYNIFLAKYTGDSDIVVGSPIAGRHHPELLQTVGLLINTLAFRNQPLADLTYKNFLQQVKTVVLNGFRHPDYQFDTVVDRLKLSRNLNRNPLFETMFLLTNFNSKSIELAGLKISYYQQEAQTTLFDILLNAREISTGNVKTIQLNWNYAQKLFKRETIERMGKHFENIAWQVLRYPEKQIGEIELITPEEKLQILTSFNYTDTVFPAEKTIVQWFEKQSNKTPERVALHFLDQTLTYWELNARANQLARRLKAKGAVPDQVIGLLLERSLEMVIGIIGILKAGSGYLPLDADLPTERVKYMLLDSQTSLVLTQENLWKFDEICTPIFFDQSILHEDHTNLNLYPDPQSLLYVIYTSGSTGKPKGVMLENYNLVNLLNFQLHQTGVDFQGKVLQYTTISFDVSFQEIFSALLAGGELFLLRKECRDNLRQLFAFISDNGINIVYLPVALVILIFNEPEYCQNFPKTIEHIILAGEQVLVTENFLNYLRQNKVFLHNHYGPSETHVVTTLTMTPEGEIPSRPPIGRPIANTQIYIFAENIQLQPIGVPGELYISGKAVGRGYLGRTDLTAERFMQNPFDNRKKMYRTGDLAKWRADGSIEYLGRKDSQVKIRGFRLELGEIESQILQDPRVQETTVIVDAEQKLAAYIVAREQISAAELRKTLADVLPEYMLPAYFVQLDRLPVTPTGKLDRQALPRPVGLITTDTPQIRPRNEIEQKLADIWSNILKIDQISVYDNFFTLGGHSLSAISVIARVYKEFSIELALSDFFLHPTIAELSLLLQKSGNQLYKPIKPTTTADYYPISSAQKRIYLTSLMERESILYNIYGALVLNGKIDPVLLNKILQKLVARHESFRTYFVLIEDEPVQKIVSEVAIELDFLSAEGKTITEIVAQYVRPFDLSKAPLFRAGIISRENDESILIFDMHHIISDGVSMEILQKEFSTLLKGQELPNLPCQYRDYTFWHSSLQQEEIFKQQEKYWLELFQEGIPTMQFPTDYQSGQIPNFAGACVEFTVDNATAASLKQLALAKGGTLFMVLLAGLNILLYKYTGKEDIVIGTPVAGRFHPDLENLIGVFVNMLPLRNQPLKTKTFDEFVREVCTNSLQAFQCQIYPIEMLVDGLALKWDLQKNPLFDIVFVMQNTGTLARQEMSQLEWCPLHLSENTAKFMLTLTAVENFGESLSFSLNYRTELFARTTIEKMVTGYQQILDHLCQNPAERIGNIHFTNELKPLIMEIDEIDFTF